MHSTDPEAQTIVAAVKTEADALAEAHTVEHAVTTEGETQAPKKKRRPKSFTPLPRGSSLGRYVILDQLGVGGMGVVYAAFDPELDRRVAIKLLQTDEDAPSDSTTGHARLLREAQAMARLTHPNVIAVYDVGSFESSVFVAMEYVQGTTIGVHLDADKGEGPLSWREILALYIAAGRGLAAAHAAGVVHRDFKPDNVMVASDGRVLVLDFGLARPTGDASLPSSESRDDAPIALASSGAMSTQLTKTGTVMGTPAYMSPEQMTGAATDAPTDQFSFCVALYKGLYGERPFSGESFADLSNNVLRGKIRDPPRGAKIPQWLRRAVLHGLQRKPADRYATMNDLLAALQRDPAKRRRNAAVAGAAAVLLAGAGIVGARLAPSGDPCTHAADRVAEVWHEARRDSIRAAFDSVGKAYADDAFDKLVPILDAYATALVEQRGEACVASRVTGSQSDEVLGLRMACLDRRLYRFDTLIETLARADQSAVTESLAAAHGLPDLDPCADTETLLSGVRPPDDPQIRAEVEDIRLQIERGLTLAVMGHFDETKVLADALLVRAEATGYPPVVAEVLGVLAELDANLGRAKPARETAMRALLIAEAYGFDSVIVGSLLTLMTVDGSQLNEFGNAQEHADRAQAVLQRMGNPVGQQMRLTSLRGRLAQGQGEWTAAIEHFEAALALYTAAGTDGEPGASPTLNSLGMAYVHEGRLDEASEIADRSLRLGLDKLGPGHPNVGVTRAMIGRLRTAQSRHGEAIDAFTRARAIFVAALGPLHPNVAAMDNAQGLVYATTGELDKSLAAYESALKVTTAARGGKHLDVSAVQTNLGSLLRELGRPMEAVEHHLGALAIKIDRLGAEHFEVGFCYDHLGDDYRAAGDLDRAMEYYALSIALFEKIGSNDDERLSYPLSGVGMVHLDRGRADLALPVLERAAALDAANDTEPGDRARAAFPLARALWEQGDKQRALSLAHQAEADLATNAAENATRIAAIRTWLGEHTIG